MKLSFLLFSFLLTFILVTVSRSQIILAPGEEKEFTNYNPAGGATGNNGTPHFQYETNYDLGNKILYCSTTSAALSWGEGEAYSLLFYDFQISAAQGTFGHKVVAWLDCSVLWAGVQALVAISTFPNNTGVKIELTLMEDQNEDELLLKEVVHELDGQTYTLEDVIQYGSDIDDLDYNQKVYPVILKRGHNYRLILKVSTRVLIYAVPGIQWAKSDYFTPGLSPGIVLGHLLVKIGLDDKETLQKLALIDSLEYKLEHHYHTYLTGRGAGHNNTQANTTLSIFEVGKSVSSPPIYNDLPEQNIPSEIINKNTLPKEFSLGQNYPNPFNPSTNISFAIPRQELVTIKVFDVLGQQVEVLMNGVKAPGNYEVNFNAGKLPSGTYIYEIRAGNFVETKKMVLMK